MREINGIYSINELKKISIITEIKTKENYIFVNDNDKIFIEDWLRPILRENKATVIVEKSESIDYNWKAFTKDEVKAITQ